MQTAKDVNANEIGRTHLVLVDKRYVANAACTTCTFVFRFAFQDQHLHYLTRITSFHPFHSQVNTQVEERCKRVVWPKRHEQARGV